MFALLGTLVRRQGKCYHGVIDRFPGVNMNFDSDNQCHRLWYPRLRAKIDDDFEPS